MTFNMYLQKNKIILKQGCKTLKNLSKSKVISFSNSPLDDLSHDILEGTILRKKNSAKIVKNNITNMYGFITR